MLLTTREGVDCDGRGSFGPMEAKEGNPRRCWTAVRPRSGNLRTIARTHSRNCETVLKLELNT